MDRFRKYLSPQTLASVQGLEFRARHVVEGYVAGVHKSPFHGYSVEFAEHREYVPGDDLRHVDWKVFGKTDKHYLKQYEEETNLISYMVLDTSESMLYQSEDAPLSKLEYAQCAAAALSYLILRQQDSVGLATFDNELRQFIRASSNPSHLKMVLHAMEQTDAEKKTELGAILHHLAERLKMRSVVVVFSDLFADVDALVAGLKHFRHRRHEVVVFHVLDPAEISFPFKRVTMFKGLEELPDLLVEPRGLRKAYLKEFGHYLQNVKRSCRDQHVDYVLTRTDQPLDVVLSTYLSSRSARVA